MNLLKSKIGIGIISAIFSFGAISCNKIPDPTIHLGMNTKEITFKVKPNTETGDLTFAAQNISVNVDSALNANKLGWAELTNASLASASFEIVAPDGATFNNIDNVSAYLKTATQPEIKVASKDTIAHTGLRSLPVNVISTNLVPYFRSSPMVFTVKGHVNAPLQQELTIKAKLNFNLEAQPQIL